MVLNGNCLTVVVAEGYGGQLPIVDFHDFLASLCTVVASTELHFRAFHLLTSAASHDLKETIILIYCFLQGLRGRFPS